MSGEPDRFVARVIPFAGAENDAHVVVLPRIGHVRQIFVRAVEINVVVVIAVEKIADIERAAQADEMTDRVGMAKGDVGGVIGAEARAAHRRPVRAAFAPRQIENIVHDDIFVGDVRRASDRPDESLCCKNCRDRSIRAINGDSVVIDEPSDRIDQAKIFVLGSGQRKLEK